MESVKRSALVLRSLPSRRWPGSRTRSCGGAPCCGSQTSSDMLRMGVGYFNESFGSHKAKLSAIASPPSSMQPS